MCYRSKSTKVPAMRKTTYCLFLIPMLVTLLAPVCLARDIYVNNIIGDDQNSGRTAVPNAEFGPVRSIKRALKLAYFGDHIVIENTGEPYRECLTLHGHRHSGSSLNPFVIEGNGAVLEGTGEIPEAAWEHVQQSTFRFRPSHHGHQQLYRNGELLPRVSSTQLDALAPHSWLEDRNYVYYRSAQGVLPWAEAMRSAEDPVGITLYEVEFVVIQELTVTGYRLDGVNAHDSAFDIHLDGLRCVANGRSGISVGGASRVAVSHCVLANNNVAQLRTEGYSTVVVTDSDVDSARAPAWSREGGRLLVDGQKVSSRPDAQDTKVSDVR
jgi:hypothetical protein